MNNQIFRLFIRNSLWLFLISLSFSIEAQNFSIIKELKHTSVKNQAMSGTCWAFATTSFIESELLRMNKGEFDLSEMFAVRNNYKQKSKVYIRMNGNDFFTYGGQAHDVMWSIKHYGILPEDVYTGRINNEKDHYHAELDTIMQSFVKSLLSNKGEQLSRRWLKVVDAILDTYLGVVPKSFNFKGKSYTAQSFASDYLQFHPEDYIEITSYNHEDYYKAFVLKDRFNWSGGLYYNVPYNDFLKIANYALDNGYTIDWNGDVSDEKGVDYFNFYKGLAVMGELEGKEDAQLRQKMYDNRTTTVDHLMHIVGKVVDTDSGKKYFLVKNSWGTNNKYKGYMYMSESYFMLKTVSIMIHKDALPENIKEKINMNINTL